MARTGITPKLLQYYDEHPDATPAEAAKALECSLGTSASAKNRWKHLRGYKIGTRNHPVKGLVKVEVTEQKAETPVPRVLSASEIATELLKKALDAISSYSAVLGERNFWKKQANESETLRKKAVEEKDRILKVHNEVVKQINTGKLPSIDEILHALRRNNV